MSRQRRCHPDPPHPAQHPHPPQRSHRLQLVFVACVALVLWTAESCLPPSPLRVVWPREGLGVTWEPLTLEIDFWGFSDASSFEVTLNGVDVTDAFDLDFVRPKYIVATALDVWGEGLVVQGANTLVARIGNLEVVRVFEATGDPHADALHAYLPGPGAGYGESELPGVVLGPPQGLGPFQGGIDVLSVGQGGAVELEFVDNVIVDGPGVDFTVFENPFFSVVLGTIGGPFAEPGRVSVSQDGVSWHVFDACQTAPLEPPFYPGCAGVFPTLSDALDPLAPHPSIPTETPVEDIVGLPQSEFVVPPGSGGDSFDLADVGLAWARYVRIEDVGPALGLAGTVGLDLDAVTAVNAAVPTDANGNGVPDAAE